MIRVYYIKEGELQWEKNEAPLDYSNVKIIWVDLQDPTELEKSQIELRFNIDFFTPQEASEIESSSRYFEGSNIIEANNVFVLYKDQNFYSKQVSFILKNKILFTLRNDNLKTFAETTRKLKTLTEDSVSAEEIWAMLLETRIDLDADYIEGISRIINNTSKKLVKKKDTTEDILVKISELQENTILIRESIFDKQRLVSALIKSKKVPDEIKDRLRIIIKDIASLLQHTEFSFERLEYMQNTFLGLVNIEQNQVIKIFTVVTVVFMPPTLIASIYGMNFEVIPELDWQYGYLFAIGIMIASSLIFLLYFKKKKWL
ncbi:MAG: magnesium/cobalt transporter CorA [Chitinophagales bacterium]